MTILADFKDLSHFIRGDYGPGFGVKREGEKDKIQVKFCKKGANTWREGIIQASDKAKSSAGNCLKPNK